MAELGKDNKELQEQLTACKDCWRELLNDVHGSSVVQQGKTKQKADQHKEMLVQGQIPWEVVLFKLCQKNFSTFRRKCTLRQEQDYPSEQERASRTSIRKHYCTDVLVIHNTSKMLL